MNALSGVEPFAPVIQQAKQQAGGAGASKKLQLLEARDALLSAFGEQELRQRLGGMGGASDTFG
jgi:hypothetical protein